jgi:hypothetical protein
MAITLNQGPLIIAGGYPGAPFYTGVSDPNPTPGPSLFSHGVGLLDTRWGPYNSGDVTNVIPAWYGSGWITVLDQAPSLHATNNIVAAAVPVAGTPLVLAGASTGITVLAAPLAFTPGNVFPTGALMIDGNPAFVQLGTTTGGVSMYDPRTMISRALIFTSAGTDTSATAAIVAMDSYGALVHETITLGSSGSPVTTTKCFKAIISITPAGTLSGSNLSVGTADVFEFPLAVTEFPYVQIYWNNGLISASTGFTAAVATTPSATTGDVRGTYATQSASDGTKKLQVFVAPQVWNNTTTTLWGAPQF